MIEGFFREITVYLYVGHDRPESREITDMRKRTVEAMSLNSWRGNGTEHTPEWLPLDRSMDISSL